MNFLAGGLFNYTRNYMFEDTDDYFAEFSNENITERKKVGGRWNFFKARMGGFFKGRGIIIGWVENLINRLCFLFKNGFFGNYISNYPLADFNFRNSTVIGRCIKNGSKKGNPFRVRFSEMIERSAFYRTVELFAGRFMKTRSRNLGFFLLVFGVYTSLIWGVKKFLGLGFGSNAAFSDLVIGLSSVAGSVPLVRSGHNVSELLGGSRFFRKLLTDLAGVQAEKLDISGTGGSSVTPFVSAGIIMGFLTVLISARMIVAAAVLIFLAFIVFRYPESGMSLIIFAIPLSGFLKHPSLFLLTVIITVSLAFIIKLVRGKRTLEFGKSEFYPLVFIAAIFLSAFPNLTSDSIRSALVSSVMCSVYFLAVNLVRTKRMVNVCLWSQVLAASGVSFGCVAQYITGRAPSGWIDVSMFPAITSRASVLFDNPNMTGFYLAAGFFSSLSLICRNNDKKVRFAGIVSSILIIIAEVFTWSRASWIGIAASTVLFVFFAGQSAFISLPFAAIVTVIACKLFPDSFGSRVGSAFSLSDSANLYRSKVWSGAVAMLKDCWISGTGAGNTTFGESYLMYALQGTETAPHTHSIYLQILIQIGVVGLFILISSFVVILRKTGNSIMKSTDVFSSLTSAAFLCGSAAVLVSGIFDNVFYNYRLICVFWMLLGLASASSGVAAKRDDSSAAHDSPNSAEMVILLEK